MCVHIFVCTHTLKSIKHRYVHYIPTLHQATPWAEPQRSSVRSCWSPYPRKQPVNTGCGCMLPGEFTRMAVENSW